jgi:hypothetical protein
LIFLVWSISKPHYPKDAQAFWPLTGVCELIECTVFWESDEWWSWNCGQWRNSVHLFAWINFPLYNFIIQFIIVQCC